MRGAPLAWALLTGLALWVGCSAQGNDIPEDPPPHDAGPRRDVIASDDDPFDSGQIALYDAGSLFDTGTKPKVDSGPPAPTCDYQTGMQGSSCPMAIDLGSVSGDTDPSINTITYTGTTSTWLILTVTEDSHSIVNHDLSVSFTLTTPSGTNYDLYAYVDPAGSPTTRSCQTVSGQSNNAAGTDDVVSLTWKDKQVAQPNDDTRLVSVRVEWVSGPCDAQSGGWTLTVQGHALGG